MLILMLIILMLIIIKNKLCRFLFFLLKGVSIVLSCENMALWLLKVQNDNGMFYSWSAQVTPCGDDSYFQRLYRMTLSKSLHFSGSQFHDTLNGRSRVAMRTE